jgi:hypothetical protein
MHSAFSIIWHKQNLRKVMEADLLIMYKTNSLLPKKYVKLYLLTNVLETLSVSFIIIWFNEWRISS